MVTTGASGGDDGLEFADYEDFDAFHRWHRPRLEQWYRSRGLSPEDAADVAQEVFTGLARRWPQLADAEHRRRSYFRIARNKRAGFFRKQGRRVEVLVSLDDDARDTDLAVEEQIRDAMLAGRDAHAVWEAVEELPAPRRAALIGRVVHRLSYRELSDETGRDEPALRQDVRRAIRALRHALKLLPCLLGAVVLKGVVRARRVNGRSVRSTASSATSTVRASLSSLTSTAMAILPQTALLSVLLTTPLHVLPDRSALASDLPPLPRAVVAAALPAGPVADLLSGSSATAGGLRRKARPVLDRLLRRRPHVAVPPVTPPVEPPDVCLKHGCGMGDRVTVRVLGHEHTLPQQSVVPVCAVVPSHTEPYVTCSPGADPP